MTPQGALASAGHSLAAPGTEYVVYLPDDGEATVDLSAATGELAVEWVHPVQGTLTPRAAIAGGAKRTLTAPFDGDAVVRIWRKP